MIFTMRRRNLSEDTEAKKGNPKGGGGGGEGGRENRERKGQKRLVEQRKWESLQGRRPSGLRRNRDPGPRNRAFTETRRRLVGKQ